MEMKLTIDLTHRVLMMLSAYIANKHQHNKTEFIATIHSDGSIELDPALRIRVDNGCYRATVDLAEYITNTELPDYIAYFKSQKWFNHAGIDSFVTPDSKWAYRFGYRKRRRWERID